MKKMKLHDAARFNLLFALLMALMVVIVFLFNGVIAALADRYPLSVDLTANAAYEIGDDTKAVLDGLEDQVSVSVLAAPGSFTGSPYLVQAKRILDQYPKYTSRVKLAYVDYAADPTFAANYPSLTLSQGDVLVEGTKGLRQIPLSNLFNYTYNTAGSLTVESSRAEEALTAAIVGVVSEEAVKVCFLTGNGASEDVQTFRQILTDNNFEVSAANLVTDALDGYDVLFLLAPTTDLSEDALKKLDAYLYQGGSYGKTLVYGGDVSQPALPNVAAFLREWGIVSEDGAVFETSKDHAYSYQPYYPLVDYTSADYASRLKNPENPVLMPLSKPLSVLFDYKDNRYVETLLSFYETAGVRPSDADDTFTASQATVWGPMPAMTLSSIRIPSGEGALRSNVIASASTAMFNTSCMANTSLNNASYIMSLLNALNERADGVSIAPKSLAGNMLGITTAKASVWGVILCAVIPLLILSGGVVIWLTRRYK